MFQPRGLTKFLPDLFQGKLAPKFPVEPLQQELDRQLGADTTLDSDKIRTGLDDHDQASGYSQPLALEQRRTRKIREQDGALRLTQIVRASTAAPTYFAPEEIVVHSRDGTPVDGAFVDGGVTPFNDPALQLLMLAALQGHGFCWPDGPGPAAHRFGERPLPAAAPSAGYRRRRGGLARPRRASVAYG